MRCQYLLYVNAKAVPWPKLTKVGKYSLKNTVSPKIAIFGLKIKKTSFLAVLDPLRPQILIIRSKLRVVTYILTYMRDKMATGAV